ncbi:MAG: hypothetical protein JSW08_00605 [archaeon]|nr:MAG: hypothetical protein JSW08_00605 [archaeon]
MRENTAFFLGKRSKSLENQLKEFGFSSVIFVKELRELKDFRNLKEKDYDACLVRTKNSDFFRRITDKAVSKFKKILVFGLSDQINREALENKKVFALVSPEHGRIKDLLYQRDSGLNHVLCKIAFRNKKRIIFNFAEVLNKTEKEQASLLGRMSQNLLLCKKDKVDYLFTIISSSVKDFTNFKKLESFERVLKN